MSLALRWRMPPLALQTRWRGPLGMVESAPQDLPQPLAAIIGPPGLTGPQGPVGASGAPIRVDAAPASTWLLAHSLGRVPTVQVYLATGEAVLADVSATSTQITVTFPSPQQGFVLAF